ncbi:hypothetical protein [Desulforamulus ruminis]|uniref:Uncharacterized protein n=1 Tax=Desulforamulus ruminis (strain ATCC 23193 / DSM 2154 / NCIMB 8452 / DL) TaxID=696281 RepID=F6DMP8_DESRL|nr:hypothetical protein [Desulforamulus ruminis]AEG58456.1 hypothetical protein Desru_0157 [Desulforamulus ruminis DSM 2154]
MSNVLESVKENCGGFRQTVTTTSCIIVFLALVALGVALFLLGIINAALLAAIIILALIVLLLCAVLFDGGIGDCF